MNQKKPEWKIYLEASNQYLEAAKQTEGKLHYRLLALATEFLRKAAQTITGGRNERNN